VINISEAQKLIVEAQEKSAKMYKVCVTLSYDSCLKNDCIMIKGIIYDC